ncbi:MAG: Unknown protein [uncultured Sulfurovum sp.]|uniref:Uncharacterized protein n=1 Tax=uncultured Sulfurovum sp. TaxID=269237 RepID=A0A6S6SNN0_9BACT|nr:MAG: Unknown protein [uncultured Sulfurovum sp.]
MVPAVATTGISVGTGALIGGIVLIAGVGYILLNSNKRKGKENSVSKMLTKEGRYEEYKSLIEDAIKSDDYEYLERKLNSKMMDFPDLIEMINDALKNKK